MPLRGTTIHVNGNRIAEIYKAAPQPPLAPTLLLLGAVSPGLRLIHHDASGHVPAGEEGERA